MPCAHGIPVKSRFCPSELEFQKAVEPPSVCTQGCSEQEFSRASGTAGNPSWLSSCMNHGTAPRCLSQENDGAGMGELSVNILGRKREGRANIGTELLFKLQASVG